MVCGADKRGKAVRLGSKRPEAWLLRHGFSSQDPVPALDFDFFCKDFGRHEICLGLDQDFDHFRQCLNLLSPEFL